jgi:adenine-specific DNA-methyltransferase
MKIPYLKEYLKSHFRDLVKIYLNYFIEHENDLNWDKNDLITHFLIRKDDKNAVVLAHQFLIQELINLGFDLFLQQKNTEIIIYQFGFQPSKKIDKNLFTKCSKSNFFRLFDTLQHDFFNQNFEYKNEQLKTVNSKIHAKEFGAIYTGKEITEEIIENAILNWQNINNQSINNVRILDFGTGTGRFYWMALKVLSQKYNLSIPQILEKNLFAIDIDKTAIAILKTNLFIQFGLENATSIHQNIVCKNMLIEENPFYDFQNTVDYKKAFPSVFNYQKGFDIIVSNPPYFLLKINKKNTKNPAYKQHFEVLSNKVKKEVHYFRKNNKYQYSIEGMLNYYKISIEKMLQLLNYNGTIGIICPSTLFGDLSSKKLRKHLLLKNNLSKLTFYPEKAKLFDNVSQATSIFYISNDKPTSKIEISLDNQIFDVPISIIRSTFENTLEIPKIDKIGWSILDKLSTFKKLKSYKNLRNRRGELDLLNFKNLITTTENKHQLIRGNMINCEHILYKKGNEFVKIEPFLKVKSKDFLTHDYQKVRLICQQISNMDTAKRLKFVFSNPNDVLSNSCNYISLEDNSNIDKLHLILNSELLNWRFKITSTNNHINNYELDELPLIDWEKLPDNILTKTPVEQNIEICKIYGLNDFEINHILSHSFELTIA